MMNYAVRASEAAAFLRESRVTVERPPDAAKRSLPEIARQAGPAVYPVLCYP